MGYTLRRSLSVESGCLGNSRLRQQWVCISVGVCCLGNGRLRQQWACISVGAGCFGNGGRLSPTEHLRDCLTGSVWNHRFVCPTVLPKHCVPAIPLAGPLSKSHSVSSSALSSLRLPVQQGTWTSTPCGKRWVGLAAATPAAGFTRQSLCLASHVSFILGNFPVLWATKISLKMQL